MNRFRFSAAPFDTAALRAALSNPAAGGFASFEGWVRNHNEGQTVERLAYETFEPLAIAEGERVLAEALERFAIFDAACVHRVGALEIGELAVWVGVSAAHRDAAFAACRYIIDEVKHRLPIWKKEFYSDGKSEWVNCRRCVQDPRPDRLHADYSRQIALKEFGAIGQRKLQASHVLVIGAGGLGVPVLSYLTGAGVGTLTIVDGDLLEASNLHRQPMYSFSDIGKPKAQLAAARLLALNPEIQVRVRVGRFDADNALQLLENADLALDCSDNFATKFLLSDACVAAHKPAIFASVYQYEGQLQVYRPNTHSPCLRCLWPEATRDGIIGNCAAAGVLGPVPGVLGSLQALEAIKLLAGLPGQLGDEILILDLLTLDSRKLRASRHPACSDSHGMQTKSTQQQTPQPADRLELNYASLAHASGDGLQIVDIRENHEVARFPIEDAHSRHIPMEVLLGNVSVLDPRHRYLLVCSHGIRSLAAAHELRLRGLRQVYSLHGGLAAQLDPS